MNEKYSLVKQIGENGKIYFGSKKTLGFSVKPKDNLQYDGVVVSQMILINPAIIEKVLKRKIKIRLNNIVGQVIDLIDNDESDGTGYRMAMDEISRHRSIIVNNYARYLEKKYIEMVLKKLDLLENEIKRKIIYNDYVEEEIEMRGKSR